MRESLKLLLLWCYIIILSCIMLHFRVHLAANVYTEPIQRRRVKTQSDTQRAAYKVAREKKGKALQRTRQQRENDGERRDV